MLTTATPTADATQQLSPRTVRAYAGDWVLFTDWCHVAGEWELPADPGTVLSFLTDCPAASTTHRRRVAAIDHHHAAAGFPRPGKFPAVRAALGRPTGAPTELPAPTRTAVETALRGLPSHGWTRGMFGRRDRCLLVLSELVGVPYRHLATLTAGHVTVVDGNARIENAGCAWMVAPDPDPVLCASCAVVRWLRALDLVVTRPSRRDLSLALKKAKALTTGSPHLCRSTRRIDQVTTTMPLLPPIDQWGYVPFPVQRLTPHSLSRRVRDLLNGNLGAHRDLPVDTDEERETPVPVPPPTPRAVYSPEAARSAWVRRRADLEDLNEVSDQLHELDSQVAELNRRAAALLSAETRSHLTSADVTWIPTGALSPPHLSSAAAPDLEHRAPLGVLPSARWTRMAPCSPFTCTCTSSPTASATSLRPA